MSSRSEYWGVNLIAICVIFVVFLISTVALAAGVLTPVLLLAVPGGIAYLWLMLAVSARRCRDADINPWWTAAVVLPYVGWIVWVVIGCLATVKKEVDVPVVE